MSEAIYDAEIAPKLAEIGKLCEAHGLPFVAGVEYAPGEVGETRYLPNDDGYAMLLASCALRSKGNIDSLVIAFGRYCNRHGIDVSKSMVLSDFGKFPPMSSSDRTTVR